MLKRKTCCEQTRQNPLDSGLVFWTRKCTRFYTYAVNIKHSDSFKTLCHLLTRILRGFFYLSTILLLYLGTCWPQGVGWGRLVWKTVLSFWNTTIFVRSLAGSRSCVCIFLRWLFCFPIKAIALISRASAQSQLVEMWSPSQWEGQNTGRLWKESWRQWKASACHNWDNPLLKFLVECQ